MLLNECFLYYFIAICVKMMVFCICVKDTVHLSMSIVI